MKDPILSICIPTWNRDQYLKVGLDRLEEQIKYICPDDIEIFVSDNCSSDNTKSVVKEFIDKGIQIKYNRNNENIGMDRNFHTCMKLSKGKFIWLLGDDDYLVKGALNKIINLLKEYPSIGLLHLRPNINKPQYEVIDNIDLYLKELTFWSTYITGNIFSREALSLVRDLNNYKGTYLLITPCYLTAAMSHSSNIMYYEKVFEAGADASSNGGYNYFKVFIQNYLNIWLEYTTKYNISTCVFKFIKKDIYTRFHINYIHNLLICKKNVLVDNKPRNGRKGFYIEDSWSILKHYYGKEWYPIPYFVAWEIKNILRRIKHNFLKRKHY